MIPRSIPQDAPPYAERAQEIAGRGRLPRSAKADRIQAAMARYQNTVAGLLRGREFPQPQEKRT